MIGHRGKSRRVIYGALSRPRGLWHLNGRGRGQRKARPRRLSYRGRRYRQSTCEMNDSALHGITQQSVRDGIIPKVREHALKLGERVIKLRFRSSKTIILSQRKTVSCGFHDSISILNRRRINKNRRINQILPIPLIIRTAFDLVERVILPSSPFSRLPIGNQPS